MGLSKKERAALKQMFGGHCAYCGEMLGEKWHADHIEAVNRKFEWIEATKNGRRIMITRATGEMWNPENDRKDNFFPACIPCNIHKHSMNIEGLRKLLTRHVKTLNKSMGYSTYRHAKRFNLIQETGKPVVFFFETYRPPLIENAFKTLFEGLLSCEL